MGTVEANVTDEEKRRQSNLRTVLKTKLEIVPRLAINGSYQNAVEFKAWVKKARKVADNPSAKLSDLAASINAYETFK